MSRSKDLTSNAPALDQDPGPLGSTQQDERLRLVRFHANGIAEAQSNLAAQLRELADSWGDDAEKTATALGNIEVEIFTHLRYHQACIRKPLRDLLSEICEALGPDDDEDD